MLCYAMLYYAMLRCSTPCFTIAPFMLYYVMLCYAKKFVYLKLGFEERQEVRVSLSFL